MLSIQSRPTNARNNIALLDTAKVLPCDTLPFIVQPLLGPHTHELYAYEVLFRGTHPANQDWTRIDCSVLEFLAHYKMSVALFVNLSNATIVSIDEKKLFAAHKRNTIYFEWSEAYSDSMQFKTIVSKINDWTERGLHFVIDDFGAGRDGFERLFALKHVTAIKFDGGFFRAAIVNPMAHKMIGYIIKECAQKSILTVGECVETEDDYRFAQSLGLDLAQGFYVDDLYSRMTLGHPRVA